MFFQALRIRNSSVDSDSKGKLSELFEYRLDQELDSKHRLWLLNHPISFLSKVAAMKLFKLDSFEHGEFITATSYKYMARGLYFSRFLRFHPLQWNKVNKTLDASHSKATKIAWALSIAVTIIHYAFLVVRTIQTMAKENSMGSSIYMTFMTAFFTCPLIFCFHMPLTWRQLQGFVNQYLRLYRTLKG